MAVVHTTEPVIEHHHVEDNSDATGWVIGLVALAIVAFLFFYYAVPALTNNAANSVQVPSTIDVNLNNK